MNKKLYYIIERHNPQFKKPYYIPKGQLSKTAAKDAEKSIYGFCIALSYETEELYNEKLEQLKKDGFSVH